MIYVVIFKELFSSLVNAGPHIVSVCFAKLFSQNYNKINSETFVYLNKCIIHLFTNLNQFLFSHLLV